MLFRSRARRRSRGDARLDDDERRGTVDRLGFKVVKTGWRRGPVSIVHDDRRHGRGNRVGRQQNPWFERLHAKRVPNQPGQCGLGPSLQATPGTTRTENRAIQPLPKQASSQVRDTSFFTTIILGESVQQRLIITDVLKAVIAFRIEAAGSLRSGHRILRRLFASSAERSVFFPEATHIAQGQDFSHGARRIAGGRRPGSAG